MALRLATITTHDHVRGTPSRRAFSLHVGHVRRDWCSEASVSFPFALDAMPPVSVAYDVRNECCEIMSAMQYHSVLHEGLFQQGAATSRLVQLQTWELSRTEHDAIGIDTVRACL